MLDTGCLWGGGVSTSTMSTCQASPDLASKRAVTWVGDTPSRHICWLVAGGLLADASALVLLQVETEDRFEWIGGSSIGGGTFWGLGALLTKTKVFRPLGLDASGSSSLWRGLEAVGLGPVLGGGCVQVALPLASSCYLVSGGWASE